MEEEETNALMQTASIRLTAGSAHPGHVFISVIELENI
jgi:hypothetical protein